MAATDIAALLVSLGILWALKELDVFGWLRGAASRKRVLSIGGFSVGLIWGPALISAGTAALSGVAAMAGANLAGITDISPKTMGVVAVGVVALYAFVRMGD